MTIASGSDPLAAPPTPRRRRVGRTPLLAAACLALVLGAAACGDDEDNSDNVAKCGTEALPVFDDPNGPYLTDVALQCQEENLNLLVTITDAQGSVDLENVTQSLIVYGQADCEGDVGFEVSGGVSASGEPVSFGLVISRASHEALFEEICGAEEWPVEVHLYDNSGHHTFGKAMARLVF